MKKLFVVLFAVLCVFTGPAFAGSGPTKDIIQPGQGVAVAQERCTKYAGDEATEAACVLFHSGVVTKVDGKYQVNVQTVTPANVDVNRQTGQVVKCRSEMRILRNGDIGWSETPDCGYK